MRFVFGIIYFNNEFLKSFNHLLCFFKIDTLKLLDTNQILPEKYFTFFVSTDILNKYELFKFYFLQFTTELTVTRISKQCRCFQTPAVDQHFR